MPSKTPESLRKMYVPLEFRTFYLKYKDTYLHELWKLLKLLEDLLQDKFEFILMLLKANKIDQAKRALKEALCQCADATTTATTTNANANVIASLEDIKKFVAEHIAQTLVPQIINSLKHEILSELRKALANAHLVITTTTTANTNATVQTQAQLPDTNVEMPDYLKDNPWVSIIASRHR